MLRVLPTGRELVTAVLAVVLTIAAMGLVRPDVADAGGGGTTTEVVYVATGENFPDALGAGPAAALGLGPILLVQRDAIPQPTLDELNRLQPTQIFIVGGTAVVSTAVENQLKALGFTPTVTRLAGADRFETAAELSAATFPTSGRYPLAVHAGGEQGEPVDTDDEVVRSVSLTAPADGVVVANSTANIFEDTANDKVQCSITTGTTIDSGFLQVWESAGFNGDIAQLAGTRGFDVAAGQALTVNLVCNKIGTGPSTIADSALTAIFVADT